MDQDEFSVVEDYLRMNQYPKGISKGDKANLRRKCKNFKFDCGVLYFRRVKKGEGDEEGWKICVRTEDEKRRILESCHAGIEGNHLGRDKTIQKISSRFFWKNINEDIRIFVQHCEKCQRTNAKFSKSNAKLHPIVPMPNVWHQVGIDLIGSLPTTSKGNKYVVTLVDYFSKWPEAAPLKDKTAASVALFLFETFCRFGCCEVIISDQGREFVNKVKEQLFRLTQTHHKVSSAYHPQTNGLTERFNQTLQASLIKVVNSSQDDWDEHLSAVLFAYRTSVQKATKLTPFEIMYCRTENGDGAHNDESDGDVHTGDGVGARNDELDGDVHTGDGDGARNDESDGDVYSGDGNCEIQKMTPDSASSDRVGYSTECTAFIHKKTTPRGESEAVATINNATRLNRLASQVELLSCCQMYIPASALDKREQGAVLLEPLDTFMEDYGLLVAQSLSQVSCNHLIVQILRLLWFVNKDVRVGMIRPVTDADIVCSIESPKSNRHGLLLAAAVSRYTWRSRQDGRTRRRSGNSEPEGSGSTTWMLAPHSSAPHSKMNKLSIPHAAGAISARLIVTSIIVNPQGRCVLPELCQPKTQGHARILNTGPARTTVREGDRDDPVRLAVIVTGSIIADRGNTGWDEPTKLLWLPVRLTGKAQTAWRRLAPEAKQDFQAAKDALQKRFEPESKRQLYVVEFQTRKRRPDEQWSDFGDELRILADKAFPAIDEKAKDLLSLERYLSELDNPKVAFAVRQRQPKTLDDAVSCTMEMVSYLHQETKGSKISVVSDVPVEERETLMAMIHSLSERMGKLETSERPAQARAGRTLCQGLRGWLAEAEAGKLDTLYAKDQAYGEFMLDTGAAVSLVRKDVWDRLGGASRFGLSPWRGRHLVGVEGSTVPVCGVTTLDFHLADQAFSVDLVVVDSLKLEGVSIQLQHHADSSNSSDMLVNEVSVSLIETVKIPAYREPLGSIPVLMCNPLPTETVVHKGTRIARATRLQDESLLAPVTDAMSQEKKIPKVSENVFAESNDELGRNNMVKQSVDTGNNPPIRQQFRRMPPFRREQARKLIEDMLKREIVQPSSSPWASPVVIATKKDGSLCFCVDYRKLNSITRKDAYPLPRIDDSLDALNGSKWFSTLDLICGYWQVEMDENDRQKTAFCTQEGLFEFKVITTSHFTVEFLIPISHLNILQFI
eukprot:Em0075g18a